MPFSKVKYDDLREVGVPRTLAKALAKIETDIDGGDVNGVEEDD